MRSRSAKTSKTELKDLFNIFQKNEVVEVDDLADFQVLLLDTYAPSQAAMATTALTLYQLEHGYDRGRFQMLLWAMNNHCANLVRVRAMVGLLLICARLKLTDPWALDQMAELLSLEHELAFDAWRAIMQTAKPDKYDPNFAMVRSLYSSPPFCDSPEMFFLPFLRGKIENLDDYEWKLAELFFKTLNVCDSDKYVLLMILKQYMPAIVQQLREQDIDIDDLALIDVNFQQMIMLGNGRNRLQRNTRELTPAEQYVQQLYRFLLLSHQTPVRVSEDINELKKTMISRMVVVGKARIAEIENI